MLPIGGVAIVQRADEGLSRKSRLPLQHLAGVGAGRGAVAELRRRRREESVMRVVGRGKLAEGSDRVGIERGLNIARGRDDSKSAPGDRD